jgi:hypothetical protein
MPKDTTLEVEVMQNELWMKRTPQERARFAALMFAGSREVILASLPDNLSERELREAIYFRTYGHHPPSDFSFDELK